MNRELLHHVACQADSCFPLDLHVFEEESGEVLTGVLFCHVCNRWYPIRQKLPEILPDQLRNRKNDVQFLKKWGALMPQKVLSKGKPCNLNMTQRLNR